MKFSCLKSELSKALPLAAKALPSNTAIQELTFLVLKAENSSLQISATDLKTYIASECEAEIDQPGMILVRGNYFVELIQSLAGYENRRLHFELTPALRLLLTVEGDARRDELPCRRAEDYPQVPLVEPKLEFRISGDLFKTALKFGSIAAAQTEATLHGFNGVRLCSQKGQLIVASLDGMRLAEYRSPLDLKTDFEWLLGLGAVQDLLRILPNEEVLVQNRDNRIMLKFQRTVYQTVLSQGSFMDYASFMPEDQSKYVAVPTQILANQLKGVQYIARDALQRVVFELNKTHLGLRAFAEGEGEAYREIGLSQGTAGLDLLMALNSKYVLDFLGAVTESEVRLFSEGEEMPVYFWPTPENESVSKLCIIMPLSRR